MDSSSVFCSLGDSRSWTDLVTNVVMLADVRLDQDLEQLTGWGTAPRSLLPTFLHEATHHWCFFSPVGFTVAALQLRVRRRAIELLTQPEPERRSELQTGIVEDLIRAETAAAFLRPLSEGLALFAEFDAMSSPKSSVLSLPLEMASYFSGNFKFSQTEMGPTPVLVDLLRWMRLDERCIQRKVRLFGYPLAYAKGGYLPGYLAVRGLWLKAASRDNRLLNETDLTLMYLRSFFFDDAGLVARLLDPSTNELESASAIANHIRERLLTFMTEMKESDISSYEQELRERETLPNDVRQSKPFLTSLRVDQELYDLGERLSAELLAQLESTETHTVDDLLRLHEADILRRRDIMYLGSIPVEVVVQGGNFRVLFEGALVTDGQTLSDAEDGDGEGSLDLFFSMLPDNKYRVVAITRGKELVATRFVGPESVIGDSAERFRTFDANRTALQARSEELKQALETVLAESWMEVAIEHVRRQLPTQVEQLYLPLALEHVPDAKLDSLCAIMREKGLLPILDWDRDLAEGVALLGLCCNALSPDRVLVSAWFEKAGLDLEATLSEIRRCSEEYGIPKVFDNGHQLLCTV